MHKEAPELTKKYIAELQHRHPRVQMDVDPEHLSSEDVHLRVRVLHREDLESVLDSIAELTPDTYLETGVYIQASVTDTGPVSSGRG